MVLVVDRRFRHRPGLAATYRLGAAGIQTGLAQNGLAVARSKAPCYPDVKTDITRRLASQKKRHQKWIPMPQSQTGKAHPPSILAMRVTGMLPVGKSFCFLSQARADARRSGMAGLAVEIHFPDADAA